MPVIRLSRPDPSRPAQPPDQPRSPHDPDLEGFESEGDGPPVTAEALSSNRRSTWIIATLAVIVLLEAIPTTLWARRYFLGAEEAGVGVPAVPSPPPVQTISAAAPPCEAPAADTSAIARSAAPPAAATATAALAAAASTPQPIAAGLLAVVSSLPLHVYSRGRLIGTSESDSLMLALGGHELEFVNESVGFRVNRNVTVQAGRRNSVRIDPPTGTLHVNAVPWAEVWVDGERLGETPIGNVQVPIGTREVVFRHPDLGERRTKVLVTLKQPARLSVDLRKP